MSKLFKPLEATCKILVEQFDQIDEDRKVKLSSLGKYISKVLLANSVPQLIVICTHNSRRSHIGQLWLSAAAEYYGLSEVATYSGGTEGTAFYKSGVRALQDLGFQLMCIQEGDNPLYAIQWKPYMQPYQAFSKAFDQAPNPTEDFAAIMVCTSADEACPIVPGAAFRVALPFNDPKAYDGTDLEAEKYEERAMDIGREMLYVMSIAAQ